MTLANLYFHVYRVMSDGGVIQLGSFKTEKEQTWVFVGIVRVRVGFVRKE